MVRFAFDGNQIHSGPIRALGERFSPNDSRLKHLNLKPPPLLSSSELARDHLRGKGIEVLGGIISPVNDEYKKKDLAPASQRVKMVELAVQSYDFVKCSSWEADQSQWTRTRAVLDQYSSQVRS